MTLGKKTVVLFSALGVCLSIGGYAVQDMTVSPAFSAFEERAARETVSRVQDALEADLRALNVMNAEYSLWDDTYYFARGENPDYVDENLDPVYWNALDIHMFLIFDPQGALVYAYLDDPSDGRALSLDEQVFAEGAPDLGLIQPRSRDESIQGVLRMRRGLMLVASNSILRTDESGEVAGTLVLGQFLGDAQLSMLGRRVTADISLFQLGLEPLSARLEAARNALSLESGTPHLVFRDDVAHSYIILPDVAGQSAAIVEVATSREIARIGSSAIRWATLIMGAASMLFVLAAWLLSERFVISPLKSLTGQILRIRETGNLEFDAKTGRADEIGVLANEFRALTSELQGAQTKLEQSRDEALVMSQMKSEFLARMSHEIRTPMNGVLGMTELLRDTQLDDKQDRITRTIYDSANSLLHIINDILDFSKIEAGRVELEVTDVDMCALVEETVESFAGQAHQKGLELMHGIDLEPDTLLRADPMRIRQVLTNLIGNAIKFTEAGDVVVRLVCTPDGEGSVDARFEISDTGIGIQPDKQQLIFDSFMQGDGTTTRVYGGTGLGLAICKQLVELMGGELSLKSEPGLGSTFSFTIPLARSGQKLRMTNPGSRFIAGRRVLIVDDNETNREILEHQLTRWRAQPDVAASANEAIGVLESALGEGRPHDLAILDMHMPNIDGLQLARAIRSNPDLAPLQIVILSSIADPASEEAMRELDIAGQLTKPVQQASLYRALVAIISGEREACHVPAKQNLAATTLSGQVLLAEDNPVNQAVAIGMLESLGVHVEVAADGAAAAKRAALEDFDAILMDCQMPHVDGFEATRLIRQDEVRSGKSRVPIIAVTANALAGDREICLNSGMDEYLTKPFTKEQLHAVLGPLLHNEAEATTFDRASFTHAAANDPGDSAPIDRSVLEALAHLESTGSSTIIEKVIRLYLESSRELYEGVLTTLDSAEADGVSRHAHALKSSSGNIGATRLAELCKRLESMGRSGELEGSGKLRVQFETEYERVVAALRARLAGNAA